MAVLPGFIPAGSNELLMGVVLAAVHGVESAAWFTLIVFGANGVRRWLERPVVRRSIDGLTGAALIGFGVKLAVSAK